MQDTEILKLAIEKGWNENEEYVHLARGILSWIELGADIEKSKYYPLIFSHDFAKAFWGEERDKDKHNICLGCKYSNAWLGSDNWEFHLQQMVLEENPIKYLEKFLDHSDR